MAQLIKKYKDGVTFGCYSERGIISHLMFRVLPRALDEFLGLLVYPSGVGNRFTGVKTNDLSEITVFSEMDFGNVGFGKPDGAVSFRLGDARYFMFIEGKTNETYEVSCKVKNRSRKKEDPMTTLEIALNAAPTTTGGVQPIPTGSTEKRSTKGYNSTIRGQLELRYRMVRLFKAYSSEAFAPLELGEEPEPEELGDDEPDDTKLQHLKGDHCKCLRELEVVKEFYCDKDGFYAHAKRTDPRKMGSWRRLVIRNGVAEVFEFLNRTLWWTPFFGPLTHRIM